MRDLLQRLFALDGRMAIVTGGGSGLGAAGVAGLAAAVTIFDIYIEGAERVAEKISTDDRTADARDVDLTHTEAVAATVQAAQAELDRIDILPNGAGSPTARPPTTSSQRFFERMIDVNLAGTWRMSREVGRLMFAPGSGLHQRRGDRPRPEASGARADESVVSALVRGPRKAAARAVVDDLRCHCDRGWPGRLCSRDPCRPTTSASPVGAVPTPRR